MFHFGYAFNPIRIPTLFISYNMNIEDVEGTNTLVNQITPVAPTYNAPVTNATQAGAGIINVDATTSIPTGFIPSIEIYSIEEKISGELQDFGSEEVVNGGFDTDSDWALDSASVTIADGKLNFDGVDATQRARQGSGVITDGLYYAYSFEVKEYTVGEVQLRVGGTVVHRASAVGVYSGNATAGTVTAGWEIQMLSSDNFIGSVDNISVKEHTTKTQRTENRTLTYDESIPETKYYIDGIEQAVVPSLPDPSNTINLNNVAVIGYPDTITERSADFNVHSKVILLPGVPTDLTVVTQDDASVLTSWDAPIGGSPAIVYEVYSYDGYIEYSRIGTSLVVSAPPNIAVNYKVRSVDDDLRRSAWSDIVTFTNVVVPQTGVDTTTGQVDIAFTDATNTVYWDGTQYVQEVVVDTPIGNPEFVTDGTFDIGDLSAWTLPDAQYTWDNNTAQYKRGAGYASIKQSLTGLEVGQFYTLSFEITATNAGFSRLELTASTAFTFTESAFIGDIGVHSLQAECILATGDISVRSGANSIDETINIDNISVRKT